MTQKFLIIGLGGAGGKTTRYMARELGRRLDAVGWTGDIPQGYQFLHIDVPEDVDVIEGDVPADVGRSHDYLGLAEAPQTYAYYDRALLSRTDVLPAVTGWRPDPDSDFGNPYEGAGQRRAVGRVIALTQLDRIQDTVKKCLRDLNGTGATRDMARLSRLVGTDETQRRPEPVVIVIASMPGGAGSGMFLDVIEILRSNASQGQQWLDRNQITVLYAADVFSDLDQQERIGIEPNTLGALSELLSATEHEGPISTIEQSLVSPGTGSAPIRGRRTARHTFIVGNNNEAVTFESSLQVFRSVAKGLAEFVTDENVQHEFSSYFSANTSGRPCVPGFLLAEVGRCSSFGHASLSLGRSFTAEYAIERLAKRGLDRLLYGYREAAADAHLRSDKSLIAEHVELTKSTFFEQTGLWELGAEHNQVLDALRDRETVKGMLDRVVEDVRTALDRGGRFQRGEIGQSVNQQFLDCSRDFEATANRDLDIRAEQWVRDVGDRVLDVTARFVGEQGLDVAIGLIVALSEQVLEASSEMKRERDQLNGEGTDAVSNFRYLFDRVGDAIGYRHQDVEKGLAHQRKALQRRHAAGICETASELLEEVATGLIEPLQKVLRKARADIAASARSNEFAAMIDQWASYEVPEHLFAAPNEVLLEEQEDLPQRVDSLLDALVDGAGARAGASLAIREIISGAWPSRMKDAAVEPIQGLIRREASWVSANRAALPATESPRTAQFSIELSPATLERAARQWVSERRGAISDHLNETLAEWLRPERADAAEIADRFVDAFAQALGLSAPLVSINPDAHAAVHGTLPPDPKMIISEIPIGTGHRAARGVLEELERAGVDDARARRLLRANSNATEIGVTSFGGRYVHPIVFDSVTAPIADAWSRCADQPQRSDFWTFRRSRLLTAFLPTSPSRQRAMIRGWLVAETLGMVDRLEGPWSGQPLSIWTPRGRRTFPQWLLGSDVSEHGSVLPALLESIPLAIAGFTGSETDSLYAYFRLIELGSAAGGNLDHTRANAELEQWIKLGRTQPHNPGFEAAPTPRVGLDAETPEQRRDAVMRACNDYEEGYRNGVGASVITPETTLTLGASWEIHKLVSTAALELIAATRAIAMHPVADDALVIPVPRS